MKISSVLKTTWTSYWENTFNYISPRLIEHIGLTLVVGCRSVICQVFQELSLSDCVHRWSVVVISPYRTDVMALNLSPRPLYRRNFLSGP